jgi:opacity protein-like surface antigen
MRAGYVMGRFLPYALVGGALGRADLTRTVTVALTGTDVTNTPPHPDVALGPTTQTESKGNSFIYGFSVGAGLDVGITENIFLRGEYEYIQFYPYSGVQIGINTGRIGVALKF